MSIRDFPAELSKEFPEKDIPSKSTIHNILNDSGFQIDNLKKKRLYFLEMKLEDKKYGTRNES